MYGWIIVDLVACTGTAGTVHIQVRQVRILQVQWLSQVQSETVKVYGMLNSLNLGVWHVGLG